jgi:RNA polymerase sigma-54 factor
MGKTELSTIQTQRQALSLRMRQAVRLLGLSSSELEAELREATLSNPLLRLADDEDVEEDPAEHGSEAELPADEPVEESPPELDELALAWPEPHATDPDEETPRDKELADPNSEGLKGHLLWQLSLSRLSGAERRIAEVLIDAIGPDGYLTLSAAEIEATLAAEAPIRGEAIEAVRQLILQLDPPGCGAYGLAECLDAQLLALPPDTPGRALARRVVREHLEQLAQGDAPRLARRLGVALEELERAVALIRRLDPRPGARLGAEAAPYVEPDVLVCRQGRDWRVMLNPEIALRLALDPHYTRLAACARRDARAYLREQMREARWLIRCVNSRYETILRVAQAVFERQRGFLEYGPMAMTPLVMREIAAALGMHESTVSRATSRKYALTPRGTYELKYFFSQGLETVEGGAASATAVQEMIRAMIAEEDPRRPLSDLALAEALGRRGITVARRTVAKYREAMKIPSSHQRHRPA